MTPTAGTHDQMMGTSGQRSAETSVTKKGRDALAKVSAAAPTNYPEKEPVMSNVTNLPQPPAGFKIQYFCSCGLGCSPEYIAEHGSEDCEILASQYEGPGIHLRENSGFQLNSYWSAQRGIFFEIHSHGYESEADDAEYIQKPITSKELAHLPAMIDWVLKKISELPEATA